MTSDRPAVAGIHHITAITGDARRNLAFYRDTLGLRLVKRTVNFDDPGTYHFYFADRTGTPGTVFTTFPWGDAPRGQRGTGEVSAAAYTVPAGALPAWRERLAKRGVTGRDGGTRFGEPVLGFDDECGGGVELIESASLPAGVNPWSGDGVPATAAIRGFHTPTLVVRRAGPTQAVLEQLLGFRERGVEGSRRRLVAGAGGPGRQVDLVEGGAGPARPGAGSVHHIAFRVSDDATQLALREVLAAAGLAVSEVRDRNYFHSIYFREPGGILFEVATDVPGFTVDESEADLGRALKLPAQYESRRAAIERALPALD